MNWPAYNEALKRRGSLTIWFDPEMSWAAAPTGRRGRQQTYSDAAIETCLSMKVLFGVALRQTTGFVESLLRLVGLNGTVPDFSTLSRRQKTLAVNIPYRGSKGPLHLLIPSRDIALHCTAGQWTAQASRSKVKAGAMPASMAARNGGSGARSTSGSTKKRWRSGLLRSQGATSVMRRSYPTFSTKSRRTRKSVASRLMAPMTHVNVMIPLLSAAPMPLSHPARTRSPGRQSPPESWRETKPCVPPNTWAARSGDDGADTIDEAASKRRCIV